MSVLAIDLGGTKIAFGILNEDGEIMHREILLLSGRGGHDVAIVLAEKIRDIIASYSANISDAVQAVGIAIPGIYHKDRGTAWVPNIPAWDDYPIYKVVQDAAADLPIAIDSDRACYISGECWKGNARGCRDAIYLAVGTGIGAGIMSSGMILRGANDIAGAIGWMALDTVFHTDFIQSGCFESQASGTGLADSMQNLVYPQTNGEAKSAKFTSSDVFNGYDRNDPAAAMIIDRAIKLWGKAAANLVSLFNPEKIIFGGGVFGPAVLFLPRIEEEAAKWAQPISMRLVSFEASALGADAGLLGAAALALDELQANSSRL